METLGSDTVRAREAALLELAQRDKADLNAVFRAVTETDAVVLDVSRVSIWELVKRENSDAELLCKALYSLSDRAHLSFRPLYGREFPAYLRAIQERRTIAANDALHDPRTSELAETYMKPLGISSMMDVPIWHHGDIYGVLCFEQVGPVRKWSASDEFFAIHTADVASLSLEAAEVKTLQQRWDVAIDALYEGVFVLDARGVMVQCNQAARRIYFDLLRSGLTFGERLAAFDIVDAADNPIPSRDWPTQRSLRGDAIRDEIFGLLIKSTGERRFLRLSQMPFTEDGVVKYVVGCCADITDEVFFSRLKRDLLSGLAHELKTPLAIARGNAEQLERSPALAPRGARMLREIVSACDRMNHFGETLLDLSSIMLGKLRLTRERIDLVDLTLSVIRRAEKATTHELKLVVRSGAPAMVIVDQTRIAQAIRQILENAMTFSPPGSAIEIELSTHDGKALLTIRDHGIGIPLDARRNIFTLFFKAHGGTVNDRGGLGIGLFLAREIVRRHGGDVDFESVEGKGSTFRLELPLSEDV